MEDVELVPVDTPMLLMMERALSICGQKSHTARLSDLRRKNKLNKNSSNIVQDFVSNNRSMVKLLYIYVV